MPDTLTITDNRTAKAYDLPIQADTIRSADLARIKAGEDPVGLGTYDPALVNTAACKSKITYIDGDKGILRYRGYPIEQLAEQSTYLETAQLLLEGELPTKDSADRFVNEVKNHTFVHENIKGFMDGFRYDAHPMSMFISVVAALSS